jgi:mRNA interferase RelE/StbE
MSSGAWYVVRIKKSAEKEMDGLPAAIFQRVATALLSLDREPRPHGCPKLRGSEQYRLRVGAYRVLYTIADKERVVHIIAVGHRRDIYG